MVVDKVAAVSSIFQTFCLLSKLYHDQHDGVGQIGSQLPQGRLHRPEGYLPPPLVDDEALLALNICSVAAGMRRPKRGSFQFPTDTVYLFERGRNAQAAEYLANHPDAKKRFPDQDFGFVKFESHEKYFDKQGWNTRSKNPESKTDRTATSLSSGDQQTLSMASRLSQVGQDFDIISDRVEVKDPNINPVKVLEAYEVTAPMTADPTQGHTRTYVDDHIEGEKTDIESENDVPDYEHMSRPNAAPREDRWGHRPVPKQWRRNMRRMRMMRAGFPYLQRVQDSMRRFKGGGSDGAPTGFAMSPGRYRAWQRRISQLRGQAKADQRRHGKTASYDATTGETSTRTPTAALTTDAAAGSTPTPFADPVTPTVSTEGRKLTSTATSTRLEESKATTTSGTPKTATSTERLPTIVTSSPSKPTTSSSATDKTSSSTPSTHSSFSKEPSASTTSATSLTSTLPTLAASAQHFQSKNEFNSDAAHSAEDQFSPKAYAVRQGRNALTPKPETFSSARQGKNAVVPARVNTALKPGKTPAKDSTPLARQQKLDQDKPKEAWWARNPRILGDIHVGDPAHLESHILKQNLLRLSARQKARLQEGMTSFGKDVSLALGDEERRPVLFNIIVETRSKADKAKDDVKANEDKAEEGGARRRGPPASGKPVKRSPLAHALAVQSPKMGVRARSHRDAEMRRRQD